MDDTIIIDELDSEFNSSQETLQMGAMSGFSFAAGAQSPRRHHAKSPASSPSLAGERPVADPYAEDLCARTLCVSHS